MNTKADEVKSQGDAAVRAGTCDAALDLYTKALEFEIDDVCTRAAIHSNRSACFLKLGCHTEALDDALCALKLRPRWPKGHLRAAQSHQAAGSLHAAIASYERAIELDPSLRPDVADILSNLQRKLSRTLVCAVMSLPKGAGQQAIYSAVLAPQEEKIGSLITRAVASAHADGCIRLWCTATGTLLETLRGHSAQATTVAWSQTGDMIGSGSLDCTARIWKRTTQKQPEEEDDLKEVKSNATTWHPFTPALTLSGHTARVSSIIFGRPRGIDSPIAITASPDTSVRVWSLSNGECLHQLTGHSALVSDIALSPCGTLLVSASGDAVFRLWDLTTGTSIQDVAWDSGPVVACGFLPFFRKNNTHNNKVLNTSSLPPLPLLLTAHAQLARQEGRVLLWDVLEKKNGWVDGRLAAPSKAVDGLAGRPTAWDACFVQDSNGAAVGEQQQGPSLESSVVLLAVACSDGTVRVWDIQDSPLALFSFQLDSGRNGYSAPDVPAWRAAALQHAANGRILVKLSPRGKYLAACGGSPYAVNVYRIDSGDQVCVLVGHSGTVRVLEWVSEGVLLTGSEDGSLRTWNCGEVD